MKTRDFWTNIEQFVFFTTVRTGWCEKWDVLMFNDEPVTCFETAKQLVKNLMYGETVGLAEFDQMKLNNAQWDNYLKNRTTIKKYYDKQK
jgi:hypothetical protein